MDSNTIPTTTNQAWGFYGTMGQDAEAAWPIAITAISDATGLPPTTCQAFLDSCQGRHFADDLSNERYAGKTIADAIAAATARWMDWKISTRTAHQTGIPRGLPYLTGFAIQAEIDADCQE